ncbi:MAG: thioredoxin [Oscillospiraceae bacterium]|nr:thioredoxin [Oscillospiraceae bacterium]
MKILEITDDNYEQEVANFEGLVLLDFWAPWCGPCRALAPIVEELAAEMDETKEKVKIGKVDVDKNSGLVSRFKVMNIPFVAVLKNGTLADSSVGLKSKKMLLDMLNV